MWAKGDERTKTGAFTLDDFLEIDQILLSKKKKKEIDQISSYLFSIFLSVLFFSS